jgi:hypothetical protein
MDDLGLPRASPIYVNPNVTTSWKSRTLHSPLAYRDVQHTSMLWPEVPSRWWERFFLNQIKGHLYIYYIILYYILLYYIKLYNIIKNYIILYYSILYYSILYYIILYIFSKKKIKLDGFTLPSHLFMFIIFLSLQLWYFLGWCPPF